MNVYRFAGFVLLTCIVTHVSMVGPANAQLWEFTKIGDDSDFNINNDVNGSFNRGYSVDQWGNVGFVFSDQGQDYVLNYKYSTGQTTTLVNGSSIIPGTTENYEDLRVMEYEFGQLLFASDVGVSERDFFVANGSTITRIGTGARNLGAGVFHPGANVGNQSDSTIAYLESPFFGLARTSVRTITGGIITEVANRNTPIPDKPGQGFEWFMDIATGGDSIFFVGTDSNFDWGVYELTNDTFTRITDNQLEMNPNVQFDDLHAENGNVVFQVTQGGGQYEIRLFDGSTMTTLVDNNTLIPGTNTPFNIIEQINYSDGHIAFWANDENTTGATLGIYSDYGGELNTVIEENMFLDGKQIRSLKAFSEASFKGRFLAFAVEFYDGTESIYLARAIPEPATGLCCALLICCVGFRRRRIN